ncbi:MAG: phosphate/phosphite/phosphonate ABC transporter substrate-binding protein [Proteobacteria bacterium]|nr:phosphate/phosphite/phosphonate ABC transporter substrate-binding protein [Pseudomonadota bacterium]
MKVIVSLIFLLMCSLQASANKYTLVIEPTYPIAQGKQVYEPLSKWLSKKTGHEIEIIIDNNYYFYWRSANGSRTPDFTFDSPHIAALRAVKKNYIPIATTIEPLTYHLISLDEPKEGETVQDFMISKTIAMLPHPSLATVYFKQWFTDLFSAPNKNVTALSWQEAVEIVFDGDAQAAIVPNWMYKLYPNFISILESNSIPGSTFMASPNVPKEVITVFQNALLSLKDDEAAYDVLVELNTEGFKKPNIDDYLNLIKLLPGNF